MVTYLNRRRRSRTGHGSSNGDRRPCFGALDLGTNNCRLLVATPSEIGGFRVTDAFSRIVRLGEGLARTGELSDAAMTRTIEALRVCADKMERGCVLKARNVATEACRQARNCDEFIERAKAETGLDVETITTEEEVRLVLRGCLPLLEDARPHALIFDIGGGSTEVLWLSLESGDPEILGWVSMPHGVVTVSERFEAGTMSAADYRGVIDEMQSYLGPFCARHNIADAVACGAVQMLGTSGTVTTLSGVKQKLQRYNRAAVDGTYLPFDSIERISARLRDMDCDGRAAHPCIGRERADLVVAGCALLEAICHRWPVGQLRVADRGLREGILCELMGVANEVRLGASRAGPA